MLNSAPSFFPFLRSKLSEGSPRTDWLLRGTLHKHRPRCGEWADVVQLVCGGQTRLPNSGGTYYLRKSTWQTEQKPCPSL